MRAIVPAAVFSVPTVAHAETVQSMAAHIIRSAGYWCARVSDVIPDQWRSTPNRTVVMVACDDGTEYARYRVTISRDGSTYSVNEL